MREKHGGKESFNLWEKQEGIKAPTTKKGKDLGMGKEKRIRGQKRAVTARRRRRRRRQRRTMGQNQVILRHPIIHCPTSEGVSKVSKRCKRTSKRMSEWPSTYVSILVCYRPQWVGLLNCGMAAAAIWPQAVERARLWPQSRKGLGRGMTAAAASAQLQLGLSFD